MCHCWGADGLRGCFTEAVARRRERVTSVGMVMGTCTVFDEGIPDPRNPGEEVIEALAPSLVCASIDTLLGGQTHFLPALCFCSATWGGGGCYVGG